MTSIDRRELLTLASLTLFVAASRESPLAIHAPSKTREILAGVVGIEIDVETRNTIAAELEDIAKATAGSSFPSKPFPTVPWDVPSTTT